MTVTTAGPATVGRTGTLLRTTGWAALAFAVIVAAQNLIRGSVAPLNNAPLADVVAYYSHHRGLEVTLSVTFVMSGIALAAFLGGMLSLTAGEPERAWAFTGFAGGVGIFVLFSTMVGVEGALVAVAGGQQPSVDAVNALWALHNGVFAVLDLSIAVALVGLSRAAMAAGIAPRVFSWLAPAGAALLAVGAVGSPLLADGSAMPVLFAAVVGFVVWLSFLAATGLRCLSQAT